jgi:hypothetical protein
MKRVITVISVVISLGLAMPVYWGLCSENTPEASLAKKHLGNLNLLVENLLVDLNPPRKSTSETAEVKAEDEQDRATTEKITSRAETYHAIIYGYKGAKIPDYLLDNFDRIFRMIAEYLNFDVGRDKVVVWVMSLGDLREVPFGAQTAARGCPKTLVALYVHIFDYLFYSPEYMKDYYMTHELLHYFIDEYEKEVIDGLPDMITKQNMGAVPLHYFLKGNEERIVTQLSKIIIRRGEHSFMWRRT